MGDYQYSFCSKVVSCTLHTQPRRMPVKPSVDDELFSMCFHCSSSETEGGGPALTQLHSSSDIKVCDFCRGSMFKNHGETLTRDKVRPVGSRHSICSDSLPHAERT